MKTKPNAASTVIKCEHRESIHLPSKLGFDFLIPCLQISDLLFLNTCSVKDVSARLRQEVNISAFRKKQEKLFVVQDFLNSSEHSKQLLLLFNIKDLPVCK